MNAALVDKIVKAVLYEGYLLYPYRPSAVKNRKRFNFGVVYPRRYSETQGGCDAWMMQTECLVSGSEKTQCVVKVRFLRMMTRTLEKLLTRSNELPAIGKESTEKVEMLEVNGVQLHPWQEAVEEVVEVAELNLSALAAQPMQWPFRLGATQEKEAVRDEQGFIAGIILRGKEVVAGKIELSVEELRAGLFKLTVRILNESRIENVDSISREEALSQALVSTHTILEVRDGEFISLADPSTEFSDMARTCQNIGTWPILVGDEGHRDTMLSSPIILYDYPEIAPESPGDLFDGGEIDEILSLRIMTLTEEEKREMRETDDRGRQILERTENLLPEQWMKLHGAVRGLRTAKEDKP
jgi:hypothetical protein